MIDRGRIGWDMVMSKMLALNLKWQQFLCFVIAFFICLLVTFNAFELCLAYAGFQVKALQISASRSCACKIRKGLRIHNPTEITKVVEVYQASPFLKEDTREI
jgi:hypothetical protein